MNALGYCTTKLAAVTHTRCHSRSLEDPQTYVWVDVAMTQGEFEAFVQQAQDAYDKAGVDFENAEQPPYARWGQPDYAKFPDRTVTEVKAEHDAALAKYEAWQKRKKEAQADFSHHLAAISNGRILEFWKQSPQLNFTLDWGHRHGQNTAYGETKIHDLAGTAEADAEC